MARLKLGVAFAGGGVRGAGHLGIMQALHESKIYPEIFVGTSAGSIVASLLAYGYEPEKALDKFLDVSENLVDVAYGHILKGIVTKSHIEGFVAGKVLEEVLKESFTESIHTALSIIATDIDSGVQVIYTNQCDNEDHWLDESRINDDNFKVLMLTKHNLAEVVRASSSLPPIFVPQHINGMKLVDGGITNNLPSDIAWAMGSDKVISLDLGYSGKVETEGFIDISHMAINILMERVTDGNSKDFGLYLNPEIYDVTALDTGRIAECFERGYVYGKNHIDSVVKMLEEV